MSQFVSMLLRRFSFVGLLAIALLGAGCWGNAPAAPTQTSDEVLNTPTPTTTEEMHPVVVEPKQWARTSTPTGIGFTVPRGYWVAVVEELRMHYLIPGPAPEPGSKDPRPEAIPRAVATFSDLQSDPVSFPTWDSFVYTMAQFSCSSGDAEDALETCTDKRQNVSTGITSGEFPYKKFTLPRILRSTKAARGTTTFFGVEYGEGSIDGLLVTVRDDKHLKAITEMVNSLHRE